jgi:hypothetical protein
MQRPITILAACVFSFTAMGCSQAQFFGFNDRLAGRARHRDAPLPAAEPTEIILLVDVTRRAAATPDEPAKNDPTQDDPTQDDPTQNDPTQNDPTQSDPTQNDPKQNDPKQGTPSQLPGPSQDSALTLRLADAPCGARSEAAAWLQAAAAAQTPAVRVTLLPFHTAALATAPEGALTLEQALEALTGSEPCVEVDSSDPASAGLTAALDHASARIRERTARTVVAILTTDALITTAGPQWEDSVAAARALGVELWAWSPSAASDPAIRERLVSLVDSPDRVQAAPTLPPE